MFRESKHCRIQMNVRREKERTSLAPQFPSRNSNASGAPEIGRPRLGDDPPGFGPPLSLLSAPTTSEHGSLPLSILHPLPQHGRSVALGFLKVSLRRSFYWLLSVSEHLLTYLLAVMVRRESTGVTTRGWLMGML